MTAHTDCLVVFWGLEDLNTLATRASPALSAYWRNFALCQVRRAAAVRCVAVPVNPSVVCLRSAKMGTEPTGCRLGSHLGLHGMTKARGAG